MAVSKLICPECEAVLRPAKPLAAGKRVKCPKCGTTFTAQGDDEDEPPRPAKKGPAKKPEAEDSLPSGIQYETSTYAVIRDDDEAEKEDKEERGDDMVAEFLKVKKTKDPRGPAQELVNKPSNYLFLTGVCGAAAYFLLLLLFIVVYLMPPPNPAELDERDDKKAAKKLKGLMLEPTVSAVAGSDDPAKREEEARRRRAEEGAAFMAQVAFITALSWLIFIAVTSFYLIGILYCALIIYGAVKTQNLTARGWGIASSVLAMVPIGALGFMGITVTLARLLFNFLYEDPTIVLVLTIAVIVIEVAWGVSIGIWNIKTLMDPVVVAGYDYIEDEQVAET